MFCIVLYNFVFLNFTFFYFHCHILATCTFDTCFIKYQSINQSRKVSDILTSTLAALLFSSHPRRERDREAHLNYYASAYNRERQPSHRKTKLNQIQQDTRINLNLAIQITQNERNKLNPGSVASYDLQPENGEGLFW